MPVPALAAAPGDADGVAPGAEDLGGENPAAGKRSILSDRRFWVLGRLVLENELVVGGFWLLTGGAAYVGLAG